MAFNNYWRPQADYEQNVQMATKEMIDKFVMEAKTCDPLITKQIDRVASKWLNEITHVEYSIEIQKPFLHVFMTLLDPKTIATLLACLAEKDTRFVPLYTRL